MVVGENKRATNIMDGIENTGDVRLHDHRLRLKQRFDIVRKLGQGTYGKVQLGINKKTGQEVAIKTIKKCKIETEADLVRIRREVQIMSSVRHPNIVHIYEVFENSEKMILVMEYCPGGELYDYLSQKKVLQEDEARRIFRQIATAVYYCHIHKICHRDLKLENVLLDETGSAKIADFGLSNVFKESSLLSTFCGSPLYASPEIVKGTPYIGPEVDCWSLGVLLYTLVYGAMPFDGSNFKRLVRQISHGDYYEPKTPSTASPLIRDMLTVDAEKRADIAYICDHPWVNVGCETSCLEMSEALAAQTPVRLDLLLSLAAPAKTPSALLVSNDNELAADTESGADLTSSASMAMAVEPSNSAEKRILDLVAEGGEDAIKPSPTRTLVSAGEHKRKLELAASNSGLTHKKERVASCARVPASPPAQQTPSPVEDKPEQTLKSSATMTISPAPSQIQQEIEKESPKEVKEEKSTGAKPRVGVKKKTSPSPSKEEKGSPEKQDTAKEDTKPSVAAATDKMTSLSLKQEPQTHKPNKLSMPGGNVGSFKEQFERRASLTSPEVKPSRVAPKPAVVSKIAKPKASSEDRDVTPSGNRTSDTSSVRLQQIGIEPPQQMTAPLGRGGVRKTESEPARARQHDPTATLHDARRSLQNSMAKLVEEKAEDNRRKAVARDIISSAIRTAGKPPMPYGRSSSAGTTSLRSPPQTPLVTEAKPRLFKTEVSHRVGDHRGSDRGVSVERIIPIRVAEESPPPSPSAASPAAPAPAPAPAAAPPPSGSTAKANHVPLRRLVSSESNHSSTSSTSGEPIKKSAREFIIPIAVEGGGYVTPAAAAAAAATAEPRMRTKGRRVSLVSGGESEEEDESHMHRLRSSRAARAESVSSGEEDEEDEGFHLLTAENLFSTLLHRVRALTNRLNGEEGPGFPQHAHSLFNNLQQPFFNSPHLSRRHNMLRDNWGGRDLHSNLDSFFPSRQPFPRGSSKKGSKQQTEKSEGRDGLDLSDLDLSAIEFSEREISALSGLTPALSRRLQRQLLAHLPPRAARDLRRTLSLQARAPPAPAPAAAPAPVARSLSAADEHSRPLPTTDNTHAPTTETTNTSEPPPQLPPTPRQTTPSIPKEEVPTPQFSTLPRLKRHSMLRETSPPIVSPSDEYQIPKLNFGYLKPVSVRSTPDRPLLRKYLLSPERSLDESYSSDSGSILSEPSYIAAYGGPAMPSTFRRHSMRDQPRKRISRFLRPDFFDTPPEESLYAKHKKEKELETQKILKEIRERRNKSMDTSSSSRTPDSVEIKPLIPDDVTYSRKCLSPVNILSGKERSRSITPFFPILDNIKETNLDNSNTNAEKNLYDKDKSLETSSTRDSKLIRPKSYPIKTIDSVDRPTKELTNSIVSVKEDEVKEKQNVIKESKIIRPKSYPTSSPSPEKVYVSRKTDETKPNQAETSNVTDIEVSFSVSLPKKNRSNSIKKEQENEVKVPSANDLVRRKSSINEDVNTQNQKKQNGIAKVGNGSVKEENLTSCNGEDTKYKITNHDSKQEDVKLKPPEMDGVEKKGTIKKKIIKKVSSKSKADAASLEGSDGKASVVKKKVTKKVKEKTSDDSKDGTTTKKKSMLQSIGQKFEKFTSTKSTSPEKVAEKTVPQPSECKKEVSTIKRNQREHSVPVSGETSVEANNIQRASTITDVPALDVPTQVPTKTTVSKVLGLFKKFEPKDKSKPVLEKSISLDAEAKNKHETMPEVADVEKEKPKRPTSLLLNGLGRKNKYSRTASDSVTVTNQIDSTDTATLKKDDTKRNSLKLDFSRLPRVKKIVPSDPVIEPQISFAVEKETELKETVDKNGICEENGISDPLYRSNSRSRSRSSFSNVDVKPEHIISLKVNDSTEESQHQPFREHEPTTPEKDDVIERIRRKSFYSRFNEKKQRRKSHLVGPGAPEYDPVARIHGPEPAKFEPLLPSQPYDISPSADMSPSTERYRALLNDLSPTPRLNRYDNYDKIDSYRSLDRRDLRKNYGRSYLDYDGASYGATPHRYTRTMSLLDDGEAEDSLGHLRAPQQYHRTLSMYAPGSYATYRPKRTRNSAIILKESEKEPSPENILEKIRQRKKMAAAATKTETEDPLLRSDIAPESERDRAECSQKADGT